MNTKTIQILSAFTVEDLSNSKTACSIAEAISNADE